LYFTTDKTMATFYDIEQRSEIWFQLKQEKFSASKFKVLGSGKSTSGYQNYINHIIFERLVKSKPVDETYTNIWIENGNTNEPIAVEKYELETFNKTSNGGLFVLDEWVCVSPDRCIGKDGLLEAKCVKYTTQIQYLRKGVLPSEYYEQVHGQIYVTGRQWCDFVSYHEQLPLFITRVHRDENAINEIKTSIEQGKKDVELGLKQLGVKIN